MRKRTVNHVADTIFWYILYFLPILGYLVYVFSVGQNPNAEYVLNGYTLTFGTYFENNFSVLIDNPVFQSLYSLFCEDGILPVFEAVDILYYFTWFVGVYLCHLVVDFILFIPRLCHKWLKMFTRGDE